MELRNAIASIKVERPGASPVRGTGTLIGARLILTALHVVADRKSIPISFYKGLITVEFPTISTTATPLANCWNAANDWVILECPTSLGITPIPLGELQANESEIAWSTFGFPDAKPDGMRIVGTVRDSLGTYQGTNAIQLFSDEAAAGGGTPVAGLSGAPCLVDGALVGVLRSSLLTEGRNVAGTLFACPIESISESLGSGIPLPDAFRGLPGLQRGDLPANPYIYLNRYSEREAEVFFGRGHVLQSLYDKVITSDAAPIIVAFGHSGVGKSSVLAAGLLPRLTQSHECRFLRRQQQTDLKESLQALVGEDWAETERRLRKPLLVILDQLEEVWTVPLIDPKVELKSFLEFLVQTFGDIHKRPQGKLLLALRKEWFPDLEARLLEHPLPFSKQFIEPLTHGEIVEVVCGLTRTSRLRRQYNVSIEEGLAERIAYDLVSDPGSTVAPMLQVWMTRLWEEAVERDPASPRLLVKSYTSLKLTVGHLADFVQRQLDTLPSEAQPHLSTGLIDDLLRWHITDIDTSQARTQKESLVEYANIDSVVLTSLLLTLTNSFLLSGASSPSSNGQVYRLCHDSLAPIIRNRFQVSQRPGPRARRILEGRVADFLVSGRSAALDDNDLRLVETGCSAMRALTSSEKGLLHESQIARADRKKRSLVGRSLGLAACFAILIGAGVIFISNRRLTKERNGAVAHQLAAEASTLSNDRMDLAALLSLQAAHLDNSFDIRTNLLRVLLHNRFYKTTFVTDKDAEHLVFVPNSSLLLIGAGNTVSFWDTNTALRDGADIPLDTTLSSLIVSRDGKLLLTADCVSDDDDCTHGTIQLWDIKSRRRIGQALSSDSSFVTSLAFSPDGQKAAAAFCAEWGDLDCVKINVEAWDLASRAQVPPLIQTGLASSGYLDFLANDQLAMVGCSNSNGYLCFAGQLRYWKLGKTSQTGPPVAVSKAGVDTVAFEHQGNVVAVAGCAEEEKEAFHCNRPQILLISDRGRSQTAIPLPGKVTSITFSADDKQIIAGSDDSSLMIWDIATQRLVSTLNGHLNGILSVATDVSGRLVASSSGKTTVLWDLRAQPRLFTSVLVDDLLDLTASADDKMLIGLRKNDLVFYDSSSLRILGTISSKSNNDALAFLVHPNNGTFTTSGHDRNIRVWRSGDTSPLAVTAVPEDLDNVAASSHDGKLFATSGTDGSVTVRSVTPLSARFPPLLNTGQRIRAMDFSPDDALLAAGADDKAITLWNMKTGKLVGTPLTGHGNIVTAVRFSPDGTDLVSGSTDGSLRIWNPTTGQKKAEFDFSSGVSSIAFSQDGKYLAAALDGGELMLMSYPESRYVFIDGISGEVVDGSRRANYNHVLRGVAFIDGSERLAFTTDVGLSIVDLSFQDWKRAVCSLANHPLSVDDMREYGGNTLAILENCPK